MADRGIPADLQDRRVEITGPVERKMVINALNANVKVFMADFEDSLAPDWNIKRDGQINLRDAVNGTISAIPISWKNLSSPGSAVLICRAIRFARKTCYLAVSHSMEARLILLCTFPQL